MGDDSTDDSIGTVGVTAGAVTVRGTGTAWRDTARAGDLLLGPDGRSYVIAAVTSDTGLLLERPYRGRTEAEGRYRLVPALDVPATAPAPVSAAPPAGRRPAVQAAAIAVSAFQMAQLQFAARADVLAAVLPGWVRGWTVDHPSGLVLPYRRDPAGRALASGNGIAASPAGDSFPEHFAALGDGRADDQAALLAWGAWGGLMRGRPGAVYHSAARGGGAVELAAGAVADFSGATYRQGWGLDNNNGCFLLGEAAELRNFRWEFAEGVSVQRGLTLRARARGTGWRIRAETEFPAPGDNRDGLVILGGAQASLEDIHIDGAFRAILVHPDLDSAGAQIRNIHLWRCAKGIVLNGAMPGGVIDGVFVHSVSALATTEPGFNVVTGASPFALVRGVYQMFAGKGSGEHFVYSAARDGTPGMRFESIYSRGSGQCFMKLRGHDGAVLSDCHGGPTSVGNLSGTNEDGFRFEYCRNIRGRNLSIRRDLARDDPAGHDGIHLNNCWNMDFGGISLDRPVRAYLYLCNPVPRQAYATPPAGGVTGITVNGLTALDAGDLPLILAGPSSRETVVTLGDITITDLLWEGAVENLFRLAPGMDLRRIPGSRIRISGTVRGQHVEFDWPATDRQPQVTVT